MMYRIAVVELSTGKWVVARVSHVKLKDRNHIGYFLGDNLGPPFATMSAAFAHAHEIHSLLARIDYQQAVADDVNEEAGIRTVAIANIRNLMRELTKITGVSYA